MSLLQYHIPFAASTLPRTLCCVRSSRWADRHAGTGRAVVSRRAIGRGSYQPIVRGEGAQEVTARRRCRSPFASSTSRDAELSLSLGVLPYRQKRSFSVSWYLRRISDWTGVKGCGCASITTADGRSNTEQMQRKTTETGSPALPQPAEAGRHLLRPRGFPAHDGQRPTDKSRDYCHWESTGQPAYSTLAI